MPESPMAAPEPLELVRRLVNTRDVEDGVDHLDTPAALAGWLQSRGRASPDPLTTSDLGQMLALREALRLGLAANHDRLPMPESTRAALQQAVDRAPLSLSFSPVDVALVTRASGLDRIFGELAIAVADALRDGSWSRLKVCQNDQCQWAFYDRSNARASKWCSMSICGNRVKQRTHRARNASSRS